MGTKIYKERGDSELGEVSPDAAQRVARRMSEGEPIMRFHVFRLLK